MQQHPEGPGVGLSLGFREPASLLPASGFIHLLDRGMLMVVAVSDFADGRPGEYRAPSAWSVHETIRATGTRGKRPA